MNCFFGYFYPINGTFWYYKWTIFWVTLPYLNLSWISLSLWFVIAKFICTTKNQIFGIINGTLAKKRDRWVLRRTWSGSPSHPLPNTRVHSLVKPPNPGMCHCAGISRMRCQVVVTSRPLFRSRTVRSPSCAKGLGAKASCNRLTVVHTFVKASSSLSCTVWVMPLWHSFPASVILFWLMYPVHSPEE